MPSSFQKITGTPRHPIKKEDNLKMNDYFINQVLPQNIRREISYATDEINLNIETHFAKLEQNLKNCIINTLLNMKISIKGNGKEFGAFVFEQLKDSIH